MDAKFEQGAPGDGVWRHVGHLSEFEPPEIEGGE